MLEAGRDAISRSRIESRTKSCTTVPCRNRTSVFDGCTLTSTSSQSQSRNSSANGITGRRHQVVIRGGERVQQQAVANQAAVDEQEDRIAVQSSALAGAETKPRSAKTRVVWFVGFHDVQLAFHHIEIDQVFERLVAEHLIDAFRSVSTGVTSSSCVRSVPQLERFLGMRQAVVRDERSDVRELGLIGPQKLLARRNVEEQIANRDGGSRGPRAIRRSAGSSRPQSRPLRPWSLRPRAFPAAAARPMRWMATLRREIRASRWKADP